MYFKRLEMHGFKSFAEPVVIEFHEGVTCIVGPNGSGKSNISDAIRWVLGEQSPKALRGGKMEEVIFNGTASRKSRGMAEVTLVIDNSTGILDIDYNEVAITRRMFRSGESEYLINNNHCRLKDIRELIMDTGIGVDGYSIIGQGKIADIVSNKPESRREIFEEAAGVVLYKSKKAEAERRLAATNNNLERVKDIICEIEGRIDGLKEDSEKASEYLKLKERYEELEINITLKNIDNIEGKNIAFKNDIEDFGEKIKSISEKKASVDKEISEAREKNNTLEKLGNDARDKLMITSEEINKLSSESKINEERLASIYKDNDRLNREIEELELKLSKEEENLNQLEKTKKDLSKKYEEAREALENRIVDYNKVKTEAAEISETVEKGKDQLFNLHSKRASKESEAKSIESFKDTLKRRRVQLEEERDNAKNSSDESDIALKNSRDEQENISRILKELKKEKEEKDKEEKEIIERQKERNASVEDLKIQGSRLSSRKKTIEEMENNYEGYSFAVKYIMRAGLEGIEGVVADLMKVREEYQVAVETALGGSLQNVICLNDFNAKEAVRALKKSKAGRLTFLPVSSIKGRKASLSKEITGDKGFKGIASDCITYSSKHSNVFEYLLGRVIIVDTMDTAINLSKIGGNGVRFVTLDGEIINASGAITGGKYKNKTANLLERKNEIVKLGKSIEEIRSSILRFSEEGKKEGERLEALRGEKEKREAEIHQKEITLATLENTILSLEESLKDMESSNDKYAAELESIEKENREADSMIQKLEEEMEEALEAKEKLESQINEAMVLFEEKEKEVSECSEEITKTRIASGEWSSKMENMDTLLRRIKQGAEDYRFQIEEKENQLKLLDEEKNKIIFGSENRGEDVESLIEKKKSLEEYIKKVAEERETINNRISQISEEEHQIGANLNSYQDQKYQMEIRLAKNETQLDTLKEKLWEDFEISYVQALEFRKENFVMSSSVKESREIKNRIRELGDVNVGSIREYESVKERYEFLTEQRNDITRATDELEKIISDMESTIKSKFKENFDQIVENFEEIFKSLFGGGHAELRMEDENNPLESGIDIIAQPPGKKLQNINLLSGGEKTMTAIALMFAVLKTKPTPFCILDEVEAALDDANIDRFSRYLRNFKGIQFALVTHQKATMEHADVLYGVTMPEQGISKVLSLRLGDNFEI